MSSLAADTKRAVRGWIPADLSRAQKVTALALALIAGQLLLRAWIVGGSWFFEDDFQFLTDIARGEDDASWYVRPHNVHFMPLSFALVKIVTWGGPFAWWLAALETVVLQAAASLSCWWMLRKLFGDRPLILVPLTFYLFSVLSVPSLTWYAAMINQLPLHTFLFLGMLAHVTYLRTRRYRYALLATLATGLGMLFYVKAIALPMVFGLIALLYFSEGGLRTRFVTVLRRYLWGWLTYGALGVAYLAMYFARMPRGQGIADTEYLALARSMLFDTLGTGLSGLSWSWELLNDGPRSVTAPSTFLVAVSWMVVVAGWGYLYATRVRALRALVIAVPYLALSYGIIAVGRSGSFGEISGNEARYLSDATAVLALVLALAMMPLRDAVESSARRDEPLLTVRPSPVVLVAAVAAYVAASVWSSVTYARPWHDGNAVKDFGLTAIASIESADRPALADVPVPDEVMWNVNTPYNLPSWMFAPLGDRFTTPETANDLMMLDGDGEVAKAFVAPGITSVPGPVDGCGYALGDADTPVTIPLTGSTIDYSFWMSIGYLAGEDGYAAVSAGDNAYRVHLERGLHTLILPTVGSYDSVSIDAGGHPVCVDQVTVGTLEAMSP
ncbi:hypothetical protein H4N58_08185 [Mumia sp. ZJ1417]|uniref:hypothetical protein n=1 Tax=Mumia sp. ZJ1417 TaxID=2708082 RepID=UPI00141EE002|nr:hypothetical protein [Mumia sp. ZJ1417]QMW67822.1 hypothetical protein H4N58_08185 [Mumia sp. ZJ1417]